MEKDVNSTVDEICAIMDDIAPLSLAAEWDNCGLQVGAGNTEVTMILLALDLIPAVIDEAVEIGAEMIITHHPLIFDGLLRIDTSHPTGAMLRKLFKYDLTLYSAHTNLDQIRGGVNDQLATMVGLEETGVIRSACETIGASPRNEEVGLGRIGNLCKPQHLSVLLDTLKSELGLKTLRVTGTSGDPVIRRTAVCGGSGGDLLDDVLDLKADLYITGDIKYHTAQKAMMEDLVICDIGHRASELPVLPALRHMLISRLPAAAGIDIAVSNVEGEPLVFI